MHAVGYRESLPIDNASALLDLDLPQPSATGHDLLVRVNALAVNPVDTKVRKRAHPPAGEFKILGWDAVGTVIEKGPNCLLFKPGDEVFYAGNVNRPGCNSEFHLVDERIVGRKPKTLSNEQAAALPLTAITAWEMIFDRLQISRIPSHSRGVMMIVGGAGGVGSIAIQLARKLTGLTVIATASRAQSRDWCLKLGAHHVIDHSRDMPQQLSALGLDGAHYILGLTATDKHFCAIAEMLRPQGKFALIDDPGPIDVSLLKRKSASLHWELMFTRPIFQTEDMIHQHYLLNDVAELVDAGIIVTTLGQSLGAINAANLREAHRRLESGTTIGKIVLSGFAR
jgi:NADPH2:quinone reductase